MTDKLLSCCWATKSIAHWLYLYQSCGFLRTVLCQCTNILLVQILQGLFKRLLAELGCDVETNVPDSTELRVQLCLLTPDSESLNFCRTESAVHAENKSCMSVWRKSLIVVCLIIDILLMQQQSQIKPASTPYFQGSAHEWGFTTFQHICFHKLLWDDSIILIVCQ